jgi:hypothetical protein
LGAGWQAFGVLLVISNPFEWAHTVGSFVAAFVLLLPTQKGAQRKATLRRCEEKRLFEAVQSEIRDHTVVGLLRTEEGGAKDFRIICIFCTFNMIFLFRVTRTKPNLLKTNLF